jgi:hypothetical protein
VQAARITRPFLDQALPIPCEVTEGTNRGWGNKAAVEQPVPQQVREPLAVFGIRLAARNRFDGAKTMPS